MGTTHNTEARSPLRLVTNALIDDVEPRNDRENVAIAQHLVSDPALAITRVTVVGLGGTYVIEPASQPEVIALRQNAETMSPKRRGVAAVRRHLPWKTQPI